MIATNRFCLKKKILSIIRFACLLFPLLALSCNLQAQADKQHYSKSFKTFRPYRVYLPSDYYTNTLKKYPVVYYFHGNKGSHQLNFKGVDSLVNNAGVILVAWNGRSKFSDDRPYNNGYHSNVNYQIQFKDYFLDLVGYIDSTYRTNTNRAYRAVIGHSMGGFMSYFLAGKYPQLIGTAVNSKGSPEFFVGYPNNHTLYQHRYMFKNLHGIRLRFQNGGPTEELVHLNTEVANAAKNDPLLDYNYKAYDAPHNLNFSQFADAFNFVTASFKQPVATPARWHHADLYPKFEVWDYKVNSNLNEPGFIELNGVTANGFATSTKKWQPDGIAIAGTKMQIQTAPIYKPNTVYTITDYNKATDKLSTTQIKSNASGSLALAADHQKNYFGISEKNGKPDLVSVSYRNGKEELFLDHNKGNQLDLRLLNRGGSTAKKITLTLTSIQNGVTIARPVQTIDNIANGELKWAGVDFGVTISAPPPADGQSPYIHFNLLMTDEEGNRWNDEIDALVMYDLASFDDIGIDDGDSEIFGSGNGNNIAEPGETIMIYQHSNRTKLYYDDPYVEYERLHDDLQPDKWGDGYALSSLIRISKDCPPEHVIRFLACYEIKEWRTIKRNVTWGTFSITVGNPKNK
jgi:enterochelin esterase-like enzyme